MSCKVTRKQVIDNTPKSRLFAVDYCAMESLLTNHTPFAHTSGCYGWNFDIYFVYGVTICTGYRGMPGITPQNLGKYEDKAKEILENSDTEHAHEQIEELLKEFCAQA